MKKKIFIPLAVIVLVAVVVSILKSGDKAEAKVETQEVRTKDLTAIVTCSGTIQPKRKVDVSANAMGTIVQLAVVEGNVPAEKLYASLGSGVMSLAALGADVERVER